MCLRLYLSVIGILVIVCILNCFKNGVAHPMSHTNGSEELHTGNFSLHIPGTSITVAIPEHVLHQPLFQQSLSLFGAKLGFSDDLIKKSAHGMVHLPAPSSAKELNATFIFNSLKERIQQKSGSAISDSSLSLLKDLSTAYQAISSTNTETLHRHVRAEETPASNTNTAQTVLTTQKRKFKNKTTTDSEANNLGAPNVAVSSSSEEGEKSHVTEQPNPETTSVDSSSSEETLTSAKPQREKTSVEKYEEEVVARFWQRVERGEEMAQEDSFEGKIIENPIDHVREPEEKIVKKYISKEKGDEGYDSGYLRKEGNKIMGVTSEMSKKDDLSHTEVPVEEDLSKNINEIKAPIEAQRDEVIPPVVSYFDDLQKSMSKLMGISFEEPETDKHVIPEPQINVNQEKVDEGSSTDIAQKETTHLDLEKITNGNFKGRHLDLETKPVFIPTETTPPAFEPAETTRASITAETTPASIPAKATSVPHKTTMKPPVLHFTSTARPKLVIVKKPTTPPAHEKDSAIHPDGARSFKQVNKVSNTMSSSSSVQKITRIDDKQKVSSKQKDTATSSSSSQSQKIKVVDGSHKTTKKPHRR